MAVTKPVSFKNKEQDLLNFVEDKDFSYYVKELIRKDMFKDKGLEVQQVNIPKVSKRKRIIDYDI